MADAVPKWFKFFLRHKPMFDAAPAESVGLSMKALLSFFENGTECELSDPFAAMLYAALLPDAKEAIEEYQAICKRNSRNGRKGGRPPENQVKPTGLKSNQAGSSWFENNPLKPEEEERRRRRSKKKEEEEEEGREAAEPPKGFAPPTLSELEAFCSENQLSMDCQHFMDYYEARGWKLSGGIAMTDWKAAARSWARRERNQYGKEQNDKPDDKPEDDPYYWPGAIRL